MQSDSVNKAREMIRISMKNIRAMTPQAIHDSNKAMVTDIRSGSLNGIPANRLIIHLHSVGCEWAQHTGGCTMCGFYSATSKGTPISSQSYEKQVLDVLSMHDPQSFPIIALYNAGNMLNEIEIPFEALEKMFFHLSHNPYIKRVSIESRLEYIDALKLKRLLEIIPGKEIELGIGVETLNEKVRDLCINKPYLNDYLQQKIDVMLGLGVVPKAYLLFKPPFLLEREAIDDFVISYKQLNQMGVDRIDCETMTVQEHSLVYHLWKHKYYRTPWLWSMIRLLEQLKGSRLYFTPFRYIVNAVAIAHNCDECSERVKTKIFDFQDGKLTLDDLLKEDCACKAQWLDELEKKDGRPFETRIIDTLPQMDIA